SGERRSEDDDAPRAHDGAWWPRRAQTDRRQRGSRLFRSHPRLCQAAAHRRRTEGLDMSEAVTFWYGCNVLRHGDIIHSCLDILRAIGFEPSPVGGPDYCCGTVKDPNQTTAGGMATRTVGKLNDRGARVVAWCPSCHSHMHDFMEKGNERHFDMTYLVDLLHANKEKLAPLLVHQVPMRVMLHRHVGFNELVPVNRMMPELLEMIPGVKVVDGGYTAPGYM